MQELPGRRFLARTSGFAWFYTRKRQIYRWKSDVARTSSQPNELPDVANLTHSADIDR